MDIQAIWSFTGSIIASVGGASVIICATSSFLSNKIANHIELNYEHRLNKEFEQYKSKLESKRYVTKTQFDSEFEIYRSLSKAFFTMLLKLSSFTDSYIESVQDNSFSYPKDVPTIYREFVGITKATSNAQNLLFENAAFIPSNLYEQYKAIYEDANELFWGYAKRLKDAKAERIDFSDVVASRDQATVKKIDADLESLNSCLRDYLSTLSIVN